MQNTTQFTNYQGREAVKLRKMLKGKEQLPTKVQSEMEAKAFLKLERQSYTF